MLVYVGLGAQGLLLLLVDYQRVALRVALVVPLLYNRVYLVALLLV